MLNPIRILERLAARSLEVPCPIPDLEMPCWVWQGPPSRGGYGVLNVKRVDGWRPMLNHRAAYLILIGDIPSELEPDHLCRVRLCWNPWHLDPVTRLVNVRRGIAPSVSGTWLRAKTHCPQGHPYDAENTSHRNGRRHCRACDRERTRLNRVALSAQRAAVAPATHCQKGHEYTPENTRLTKDGKRKCRTCNASYSSAARERRRSAK